MPSTAEKIFVLLNVAAEQRELDSAAYRTGENIAWTTRTGAPLFPRIDLDKEIAELVALMQPVSPVPEVEAVPENLPKPDPDIAQITIDDFGKVELRVGLVTECDYVKKSDKLLLLKIDLGYEQRQVVSGIRKWYTPDALIGKKIILVANLKPAMLRGIESQGMVLAADSGDDVKVIFADDDAIPGSRIR
jgi:methionyl-tRNA synthetase